jgi:CheY-like chemotaxis protein
MIEQQINILIAEDNPGDVFLVRRALASHGLKGRSTVVTDGEAAIQYLDNADSNADIPAPDLVLLDLNLPRHEGGQVLARLRKSSKCGQARVIIMTSSESPHDREMVRELGADLYFNKPSDLENFMQLGAIARQLLDLPPRG